MGLDMGQKRSTELGLGSTGIGSKAFKMAATPVKPELLRASYARMGRNRDWIPGPTSSRGRRERDDQPLEDLPL